MKCLDHMTNNSTANALGNVGSSPVETLYTIVHAQQNAIYFDSAIGDIGVPRCGLATGILIWIWYG
jgi:hypothetical protein